MQKRIKQAKASKVREFVLMNPTIDAKTVAEKFHAPLQTVYNIRYHLKKKLAEKGQGLERATRPKRPTTNELGFKRIDTLLEEWKNKPKEVTPTPTPVEVVKPKTPQEHFKDILDNYVQPDPINHPAHYTHGGIETIDFIQAKLTPEEFRGYLKGNILKYGSRIGHKDNDMQDAGKLAWYTNKLRTVLGTK